MFDILENSATTFNAHEIFFITLKLFPASGRVDGENVFFDDKEMCPQEIFDAIEDSLCDIREAQSAGERRDFLDLVDVMSWAIYRVWKRLLSSKTGHGDGCFESSDISKDEVLKLFFENLSRPEDAALRGMLIK